MFRRMVLLCLLPALFMSCANRTSDETVVTGADETVCAEEETENNMTEIYNDLTPPCIVPTVYETEDIVIADIIATEAPYFADPTGEIDSTDAIRRALDDCFAAGGGTVYLPVGVYRITESIQIPPFVTLRGDWQDPDAGTEYGTVIKACVPSSEETETGLFVLGGSGGVVGLTVFYPEQGVGADAKPYPFTFYTNGIGRNYMLSTIKNVTVLNGYRGIGACLTEGGSAHEQLTVENFKGTFLKCGAEVYNQADVGTWQGVTVSTKYWKELPSDSWMTTPGDEEIDSYIGANATGLILGDLEWTEFKDLRIDGCRVGLHIVKGKRIEFAGSLYDISVTDCQEGLRIDSIDERWGMVIADGVIEGSVTNNTLGLLRMTDVEITGDIIGVSDDVTLETKVYPQDALDCPHIELNNDCDFDGLTTDRARTYVKPADKLYVWDGAKDGTADISGELQRLLDEAGKTGGVVYLPAGMYRLDAPVSVPRGVELRGASSVPTRDQGGLSLGTILIAYYGDDEDASETDPALITLAGDNAGLNGIRIAYPENGPYDDDLGSTYTVRGTAKGVYMTNCAIIASANGVDFSGCDEHFIKKVTTCCYSNTFLLGGKNGYVSGCLQNATVIVRHGNGFYENWLEEGNVFTDLFNPVLRIECDYMIVDGAENQTVMNTFAYGVATFLTNRNSENTLLVNVGSDNLGDGSPQIIADSGSLTGINVMRWNGVSFEHYDGSLKLFNRLTIGNKAEKALIEE